CGAAGGSRRGAPVALLSVGRARGRARRQAVRRIARRPRSGGSRLRIGGCGLPRRRGGAVRGRLGPRACQTVGGRRRRRIGQRRIGQRRIRGGGGCAVRRVHLRKAITGDRGKRGAGKEKGRVRDGRRGAAFAGLGERLLVG